MKNYELKTLKSADVFLMVKVLNKVGFNEIKERLNPENLGKLATAFMVKEDQEEEQKENKDELIYTIGISVFLDIVDVVLMHLPSCEDEIYNLLASCSNLSKKELKELSMVDFTEMIYDFVHKEEFKDFFKVVSKFVK